MATETNSALMVRIEASQAKIEKQLAAIAKRAANEAKGIEDRYKKANDNVANSLKQSSDKAVMSVGAMRAATTNLSYQLNDVAVSLAGGASPFTVMMQQGSQVAQVFNGSGGIVNAVKLLGGAFSSVLNPVSLASFAIIGLTGAAYQYFTNLGSDTKDADEVLKGHSELIRRIKDAYGEASVGAETYAAKAKSIVTDDIKQQIAEYQSTIAAISADLVDQVSGIGQSEFGGATYIIQELQGALNNFQDSIKDGDPKIQQFKAAQDRITVAATIPVPGQKPNYESYAPEKSGSSGRSKKIKDSFDDLDGVIAKYVQDVVKAESGGRANAKNPLSSATGLGQFIESTWLDLFRKNFPDRAKSMSDQTILALRNDADISKKLIEAYARENAAILRQAGVSVNEAALHLAHFLGPQGAASVLKAKSGTPVSQVLSQSVINANPTILGGGKTVDDVVAYAEHRVSSYDRMKEAAKAYKLEQRELNREMNEFAQFGKDLLGGFISDLQAGKSATEALGNALQKVANKLLDSGLNMLLGLGSGGGGWLGQLFGFGGGGGGGFTKFLGLTGLFDKGGYTGHGAVKQPAGIVHRGEVVWSQADIRRAGGVGVVEAMRRGIRGYDTGGIVGRSVASPAPLSKRALGNSETINVVLQDDSGRMAAIADQRIQTASGTIVQVSVQQSAKAVRSSLPSMIADAQTRKM